ncbi:lantibiotic dehydratase [Erythrobacter crassostreae]|uniref:Lantibiotic dehydratase n=1 Tax=Erythrobacter crassostreae TaxID=2828328 RepID=A0A9X1F7P1_9SPHN|nr:lantibiotic dehydratase [Erythrobacter crassostrea]MBV7260300.1 lantibiotic dehydratase [Erythrobacter crassostrea]
MNVVPSNAGLRAPSVHAEASEAPDQEYFCHPNMFFRVAGLPFQAFDAMCPGHTFAKLTQLRAMNENLAPLIDQASSILERAIGHDALTDQERRSLIKLRRDIFNQRVAGLQPAQISVNVFADGELEIVSQACDEIAEVVRIEKALADEFASEIAEIGSATRYQSLASENFLKALSISAPKCIDDLYASQANPAKYTGKRGRNLNAALFNYLMRASTKVSPLSYFTPIGVAKLSDGPHGSVTELTEASINNEVQISRRAMDQILFLLTRRIQFWGQDFPLKLNPTVKEMDGYLQFAKLWDKGEAGPRVWGTMLPFGRVPNSPGIGALVAAFTDDQSALNVGEIYSRIAGSSPGFDQKAFVRLVAQSLAAGLLLPDLPILDQESDLNWLAGFVKPRFPELGEELEQLEAKCEAYSRCDAADRVQISRQLHGHFAKCLDLLKAEENKEPKGVLFYEDCFLAGPPAEVGTGSLGSVIEDTHVFSELFPLLDFTHMVQSITASLFAEKYGAGVRVRASDCVDELSQEATAYAQSVSPLPLEEQRKEVGKTNANADKLLALKAELLGELAELLRQGEPVDLDEAFIASYRDRIPNVVRNRATSYTVIGQLDDWGGSAEEKRHPAFAINRLYSGHSMLASRFLSNLSEGDLEDVRGYISRIAEHRHPFEMPGAFGFNANLHPRFVDTELKVPGRRPNYGETEKLSLDDIFVEYDEALDRLCLTHERLGELAPHYFGFLVLRMLPSEHQLLVRMNMQGLIIDLWQDLDYAGHVDPDEVVLLPRVTFGSLILMRRSLFIPPAMQPDPGLDEFQYFRAFEELLHELGGDADYFARLMANQEDIIGGQEGLGGMGETTDFKPSYLSLKSPPTIAGLQRRLRRRPRRIVLQETLPAINKGGVLWNGDRHACEIQFEVSKAKACEASE